jgi:hypothetical protein
MDAQIGRFNMMAATLAAVCLVLWAWQVRQPPVNQPHYNVTFALRPPLPPDAARAGPQKSDHSAAGPNSQDSFQGEVVSPDDEDQGSRSKNDDSDDDEMNPEDQVYPI